MKPEYELRQITTEQQRAAVTALLERCNLQPQISPYCVGIFDASDRLVACAGLDGYVIKGVAVDPKTRDLAFPIKLISHLIKYAREKGGVGSVMIFTKPEYKRLFMYLGMKPLAQAPKAVLLEAQPTGLDAYVNYLREESQKYKGKKGVIVMNANPLTMGHAYLVETVARQVDHLFIIPVMENQSEFSYAERRLMLLSLEFKLDNVHVLKGSRYVISAATFPTYFIKEASHIADTHINLDCNLFANHIAPALGATVRFVGSEPKDPLTNRYNVLMKELLPLEVVEIPRIESGNLPISASRVRKAMHENVLHTIWPFLAPGSRPYVLAHAACQALTQAHGKMSIKAADQYASLGNNCPILRNSIKSLTPLFARMAIPGITGEKLDQLCITAEHEIRTLAGFECMLSEFMWPFGKALAACAHSLNVRGYILREDLEETSIPALELFISSVSQP